MKIISWNINGIKSCVTKGLCDFLYQTDADIFCMQEIKTNSNAAFQSITNYYGYYSYAQKAGYSGTAVLTKKKAHRRIEIDKAVFNDEGRIIVLEYDSFYLINCYSPHSKRDLSRIDYKHQFNSELYLLVKNLSHNLPVIICGDLNVAHQEIDIKNYKNNYGNAGFTEIEREDFSKLLSLGLIDTYRYMYPSQEDAYTWWSYRKGVRERNIGWRIDYILADESLKHRINSSIIHTNTYGSDHCPISLNID